MLPITLTPILLAAAFPALGAERSGKPAPRMDAVTSPSRKVDKVLPPRDGDAYQVIGRVPGINGDVVRYDKNFYRGGMVSSEIGMRTLKERGIKTIISTEGFDRERQWARQHGIEMIVVEVSFSRGISKDGLSNFLSLLSLKRPPFFIRGYTVYHRGGMLGMAYRMFRQRWSREKALEEFKRLGGDLDIDGPLVESISPKAKAR